ncbi:hypothetical protein CISG_06133 [Coccidioides immitis RMSCC 3703]|uniref:Aminoglycoside phosphotransferase domain-containing protein n=1 Tax=Coccidioides immitis RMSCC 3703 TaxID=454286 RepID=A0A0J8QYJ9_COCIT|nr:hypothetical protein CISG_06133 [Coccidioides immitis RMSCC 3703]
MHQMRRDLKDSKHDLEALHRYTSGRWLWNEHQQLACRYVKFDMSRLLELAVSLIGSKYCVEVVKISEGQYNKVFLLTMNDGREVIVKLPNPNAGRPCFTTASEVATMDFLRNILHLPVPKVYAWSSKASENPVGAEYIIMEKQAGVMLSDVWESMKGKQKAHIVLQVVDFEKTLTSTKFTKVGALYYKDDLPAMLDTSSPLYVDKDGKEVHSAKFGIGPTNHRSFFDFGRGKLDIDHGPSLLRVYTCGIHDCHCASRNSLRKGATQIPIDARRPFLWTQTIPAQLFEELSALHNYLKVAPYVLPDNRAALTPVLWHGDLHLQNIFVDPGEPTRILGIVDWQCVSICPLFMQVTRPGFLDYNGPAPEGLRQIHLPGNFDSMTSDEQRNAKALHQAQTLHNLYLARSHQVNEEAFQAMQGQDTLRHQVSVIPGLTLMDYEPCLSSLLRDVEKRWPEIVGIGTDGLPLVPCPLQFSAAEIQEQERDEELWAQGVGLMNNFISDTGCFKHWDGKVSNADYESSKRQLAEGIQRFLGREARNEEECKAWLKALPFVDQEDE